VLVPAAMERVIDAQAAENLKCRVLAEGANDPTTPDADLVLEMRHDEIFLIPDILCNSGGVVVSYFERMQDLQQLFWEEEEVVRREYHILDRAFEAMLARAKVDNIPHRTAAMAIGIEKVRAAKKTRGVVSVIEAFGFFRKIRKLRITRYMTFQSECFARGARTQLHHRTY
jgi:glutamate dehydrogenase (NAD(P)+)